MSVDFDKFIFKNVLFQCFYLFMIPNFSSCFDPYATLRVQKSASLSEIRKAYKLLAKEWHPDKNKLEEAEKKFVEINQAYEILSNSEQRKLYDQGKWSRSGQMENQFYNSEYHTFEDILTFANFRKNINFSFNRITSIYQKMKTNSRTLEEKLLPESIKQPCLLLAYADFCMACMHVEPLWEKLVAELEPRGLKFYTIDIDEEIKSVKLLSIRSLPSIILLIGGKSIMYRDDAFSTMKIYEFVKNKFPSNLIQHVTSSNLQNFLNGWLDNKVRVLILSNHKFLDLNYFTVAYQFQNSVNFGYLWYQDEDARIIKQYLDITDISKDILLIYHENVTHPVAMLQMNDIPTNILRTVIHGHQYLLLPRITSQEVFDDLCPVMKLNLPQQLCVILLLKKNLEHDKYINSMRNYIASRSASMKNIQFAYIFCEQQKQFIQDLQKGKKSNNENDDNENAVDVVITSRKQFHQLQLYWLSSSDIDYTDFTKSQRELEKIFIQLLNSEKQFDSEIFFKDLLDENAKGLINRVLDKLYLTVSNIHDNVSRDDFYSLISLVATMLFIALSGYFMAHLVKLEEQNIDHSYFPTALSSQTRQPIPLNIHELRAETYNGLVRLLKPGCRTIILVLDHQSQDVLLPQFRKFVRSYRKNRTLMFAFMYIERGLEWFRRILLLSLPEQRELNINPRNCVGTVLSLNGYRKYFCMYHAKHSERRPVRGAGAFIGFDSESSDSDMEKGISKKKDEPINSQVLFEEHLLEGLPNWLEKLFKGSTRRYYIRYWPNWIGK